MADTPFRYPVQSTLVRDFEKLLAHRARNPPPSLSLAEETTPPLPPYTLLAPLAQAAACEPLPSSLLADERRVCSLDRPGQRRASLAPCGGARFPTLAAVIY